MKIIRPYLIFTLATLLLIFYWSSLPEKINSATFSPSINLGNSSAITLDNGQLQFYQDKTQNLSFKQIQSEKLQNAFQPLKGNLGLGYIPDNVWLKFSIERQEADQPIWWLEVLPAYLDDIRLFHIDPAGKLTQKKSGDSLLMSQKQENYRGTIFKLDLLAGQHQFYIRLKSSSTISAIVKLWQPDQFNQYTRSSYFVFGLYFSLILTVFLFTSVNWLIIRQSIFFYYALYLLLNATQWLAINGFVSEFIFPEQPLYANLTLGLSLALAAAFAYLFYTKIYELKRYHPATYLLFMLGAVVGIITAISVPFGHYQKFTPILLLWAIMTTLITPWILVRLWQKENLSQRLIVIAFGVFSILLSINILSTLSIIPFNELTIYLGMLSNLCHILILHFALILQMQEKEQKYEQAKIDTGIAQETIRREKQLSAEQGQFLEMMTHEIRTPIAVIDAANESLKILVAQKKPNEEQTQRRFHRISNAVKKLNTVLEMALINSKHESWPFELQPEDLISISKEAIELLGLQAENTIRIEKVDDKEIVVKADRRMLRIAMLNIIDNAVKYSPLKSTILLKIYPEAYQGNNGICWLVNDLGAGIPDIMIDKIFNKYQRGDDSSNRDGLGLGLYLFKNVIEQHQGHIKVKNLPDKGAQIGFWLPL